MTKQPAPTLPDYQKKAANFDWQKVLKEPVWYQDGALNAAYTAIDQPAVSQPDAIALIWYDHQAKRHQYTYSEIRQKANQFAHFLRAKKLRKGERVFFFLPRVPEVVFGFLGALKAGGVVGTLFPAFAADALEERLKNSGTKVLVTTSELYQRVKGIRASLPELKTVILIDDPI
ncbi:AMP-binding protein, partial [Patescibacteria group bacterium]|nr:AMP-binding protein [Patescibacteria group bacterium]